MAEKKSKSGRPKVVIAKDGPYLVSGGLPLAKEIIVTGKDGVPARWGKGGRYPKQEAYSLCRCGKSKSAPYCDGTHNGVDFDGTETASRKKYMEQAEKVTGGTLVLTDVRRICAQARFCDKAGGVWQLTVDSGGKKARKLAIQEACDCPAGRLVQWDKKKWGKRNGKPIEPKLKPSISLVEDPEERVSGPIWVKGGVPVVSSNGKKYEARNRVTLCRCGRSRNKPFCDGSHIGAGFSDGDRSLRKGGKK